MIINKEKRSCALLKVQGTDSYVIKIVDPEKEYQSDQLYALLINDNSFSISGCTMALAVDEMIDDLKIIKENEENILNQYKKLKSESWLNTGKKVIKSWCNDKIEKILF